MSESESKHFNDKLYNSIHDIITSLGGEYPDGGKVNEITRESLLRRGTEYIRDTLTLCLRHEIQLNPHLVKQAKHAMRTVEILVPKDVLEKMRVSIDIEDRH